MLDSARGPFRFYVTVIFLGGLLTAFAGSAYWNIRQLNFGDYGSHPSINTSNEIVWALEGDLGIYSNVRGKLTDSGQDPHLANSGEVVYAAWFGGPQWDLVSTTRGRLTFGSSIDLNASSFGVNALGEVVYAAKDANSDLQIFSTVRGQLTFMPGMHLNPCINDHGEVIWIQSEGGPSVLYSTVRGIIPGGDALPRSLNNAGELCYSGNLESPPGYYSFPHIFSSTHGPVSEDPAQYQWDGSMNDAGTIVYRAPESPGSGNWHLYQAQWVAEDTTPPVIRRLSAVKTAPQTGRFSFIKVRLRVDATDDTDPAPVPRIVSVLDSGRQADPQWKLTGPLTAEFRGTRPRRKNWVYTFVVECQDVSGNVSTRSIAVSSNSRPLSGRNFLK